MTNQFNLIKYQNDEIRNQICQINHCTKNRIKLLEDFRQIVKEFNKNIKVENPNENNFSLIKNETSLLRQENTVYIESDDDDVERYP